jgi:hypothetical protein
MMMQVVQEQNGTSGKDEKKEDKRSENPYVEIVSKKLRALRKKMV